MKGVAIYFEGGGDTAEGKARLRRGMSDFLKALRDRRGSRKLEWKVIPCGPRGAAFDAFVDGLKNDPDTLNVLLVDAEDKVTAAPSAHLAHRDGWDLSSVDGDAVHLMVSAMETWIVADGEALAAFYGQGFNPNSLPKAQDLESVAKETIARALENATSKTKTKGAYHKIRHASELLALIRSEVVRKRCKHCERLFAVLEARIGSV